MFKSKGTAFLFDALLASAKKSDAAMSSILADAMQAASTEIDRLNAELEAATRHMEMAEAAWLRETAGNTPKMHTTPGECSVPFECTLLDEEVNVLAWIASAADETRDSRPVMTPKTRAVIRGLLARLGGDK